MFIGDSSLILRLDPNYIFDYVLDEEKDIKDRTVFKIKPLSILQFAMCKDVLLAKREHRGASIGSYGLKVLKFGLVGWENFKYSDNGDDIPYGFKNFGSIHEYAREEIFEAILEIGEVDQETENIVRLAIKWSNYLSNSKNPGQWDCEYCQKSKASSKRNCDGTALRLCRSCHEDFSEVECPRCGKVTSPSFILKFNKNKPQKHTIDGLDYVTRCPIALLEPNVINILNVVSFIDDTNSLPVSGAALEQSHFYYRMRQIMLGERNEILNEGAQASGQENVREIDLTKKRMGKVGEKNMGKLGVAK